MKVLRARLQPPAASLCAAPVCKSVHCALQDTAFSSCAGIRAAQDACTQTQRPSVDAMCRRATPAVLMLCAASSLRLLSPLAPTRTHILLLRMQCAPFTRHVLIIADRAAPCTCADAVAVVPNSGCSCLLAVCSHMAIVACSPRMSRWSTLRAADACAFAGQMLLVRLTISSALLHV